MNKPSKLELSDCLAEALDVILAGQGPAHPITNRIVELLTKQDKKRYFSGDVIIDEVAPEWTPEQ